MSIQRLIRRRVAPAELLQGLPADMHPVLRRVYAARNIETEQLVPSLSGLIPVGALNGDAAAMRLADARERQERVLILGDFDADGATATALCVGCLRAMGFENVTYLVPNRIEFGYGLSVAIADEAAKLKPDLIVTVDNGISSIDGIARARQQMAVACGFQSRVDYLTKREPTYRAAALANLLLPDDAHILSLDYRGFYFKHRVTREKNYAFRHDYAAAIETAGRVDGPLLKAGFTHILLAESLDDQGIQFNTRLPRYVDRQLVRESKTGTQTLKTLHDYIYQDIDGVRRRYRLIALR